MRYLRELGLFQFTQPKRAATSATRAPLAPALFQFTQPKRAATDPKRGQIVRRVFQFTQPKRAATASKCLKAVIPRCFNSRSPSGLRPSFFLVGYGSSYVSIHAAQAGCDNVEQFAVVKSEGFQFTQPKRAATVAAKIQQKRDSLKG